MTAAPEETEAQRLDRELSELMQELRLMLPGAQVLFAFLLLLPFSGGFAKITPTERFVYLFAFLLATSSTVLLMAPAPYHRLRWRQYDKARMLPIANRQALGGNACLALSMTAVVFLITEVLFGTIPALGVTSGVAGLIVWLWYQLPLGGRPKGNRSS